MNNALLEFNNVTKKYGKFCALNDINLTLYGGAIIGLLGPNGSGKTTMLKTIMRIIRQQKGNINICGVPVSYETRKYISFMPDKEFLYSNMKVIEAMKYYMDAFKDFDMNRAKYIASLLGIDLKMNIDKMSKGNKEKVVLMLTLSRVVPIYLLDEPLGSLDPVIKHEMLTVIKRCSTPDNLILISTHLIKDTEEILDKVLFLKQGQIVLNASLNDIKSSGKTLEQYYLEVFSNV